MKDNVFSIIILATSAILIVVMNVIYWPDPYNYKFVIYGAIFGFIAGGLFTLGLSMLNLKKRNTP